MLRFSSFKMGFSAFCLVIVIVISILFNVFGIQSKVFCVRYPVFLRKVRGGGVKKSIDPSGKCIQRTDTDLAI